MKLLQKNERSLTIVCQLLFLSWSSSFQPTSQWHALASRSPYHQNQRTWALALASHQPSSQSSSQSSSSSSSSSTASDAQQDLEQQEEDPIDADKNNLYINGLIENLSKALDGWIISGAPASKHRVYNLVEQVERESFDDELISKAKRMVKRAGLPLLEGASSKQENEIGRTDSERRRIEADARKNFDSEMEQKRDGIRRKEGMRTSEAGSTVASNTHQQANSRSALSRRANNSDKPDLFLKNMDNRLDPQSFSQDKNELERALTEVNNNHGDIEQERANFANSAASTKFSELVARAGAGDAFEGETLGIGGLDDVLAQVKRRVWIPLAAPPKLLDELGIHPVRGLLLYGRPGCGKTLIARTIGQILSPARPLTVVAGPAIMDKFVGSSEKNLREIFDNPPDIYDSFCIGEHDGGESISRAALHVVIMDEFDAIARTRGGQGRGGQGDAGVARDSLVNQLLACLDGVEPTVVPTLVVGLTNKRSLIDPALLRPGRFEVQVEVPPPRTASQRISIIRVHTKNMFLAGRLLVSNPPTGTAAARYVEHSTANLQSYEELLDDLAAECDGMSGASLAGVARAAASHALERVVDEFSSTVVNDGTTTATSMMDCLVTREDFACAISDVHESSGDTDWELTDDERAELETKDKKEAPDDNTTSSS